MRITILGIVLMLYTRLFSSMASTLSRRPSLKTLLVGTRNDPASMTLVNALIDGKETEGGTWQSLKKDRLWKSTHRDVHLWLRDDSLLNLDNPHKLVASELNDGEAIEFDEVVFLSKHSAASGVASLTVHPIGVPWLTQQECDGKYGGLGGHCSPPSASIAALYRNALQAVKDCQDDSACQDFEVTLEATHHGPYCELPSCFVEIGSDESQWSNEDAGRVWAAVLGRHYGLHSSSDGDTSSGDTNGEDQGGLSVVILGGGHYCPKMNDVARMGSKVYVGHALASYALNGLLAVDMHGDNSDGGKAEGEEGDAATHPTWQSAVRSAITTTRLALPFTRTVVLIDKKAFKSAEKAKLIGLVERMGLDWTHNVSQIKKMAAQA